MKAELTARWTTLDHHKEQSKLWNVGTRFRVVPAGRRSGKTELAKRFGVMAALTYTASADGWFVFAAPTHKQAKRIFWKDIKAMIPKSFIVGKPSESEMTIKLLNGCEITVLGLDAPERIEGRPIDWICCDEYANMKPEVWTNNLRPALSTRGRLGAAWLIGVPEGRNHYYTLSQRAQDNTNTDWSYHHWLSSDILPPGEIEAAKNDLDELTYQQEYEASFVNFSGRAYYAFNAEEHCIALEYKQNLPIIICFDFNVSPGIAVICQEQTVNNSVATCVIGEVYIPRNSNTSAVCRKIVKDWGHHKNDVLIYGDATGGAKGTSQVRGSDWDIIRDELRPTFTSRLKFRVPRANPRERSRVNSLNTRLKNANKHISMYIDSRKAPYLVVDLEGTVLLEGGSGELDKNYDPSLTHMTDALGYYTERVHPTSRQITKTTSIQI